MSATTPPRADTLLPDDDSDPAPDVAEEVSLDQQSGQARRDHGRAEASAVAAAAYR